MIYGLTYVADPNKRGPGFGLQAFATLTLLLGALGKAVVLLAANGI